MNRFRFITIVAMLTMLAAVALTTAIASAHERRDVANGTYQFVVGFMVEPPYEGQKNGVDFRITRKADNTPLTGAEVTLKVDVTYVPNSTTKTFDLRTIFGAPGQYTADLIPSQPGYYRFRFYGVIKDGGQTSTIDETFNSKTGGGGFNDVQPQDALNFPDQLPSLRQIDAATRGAQTAAQTVQGTANDAKTLAQSAQTSADGAKSKASTANTLAIAGIVLGLVGSAAGVGGIMMGRKRS